MKDVRFVFSPVTALRSWNWLTRTQRELGEPWQQAEAPPEHNPVPQSLPAFWLCQRAPLSNAGVSLQGAVAFKGKTGTRGMCWNHGRPTADPQPPDGRGTTGKYQHLLGMRVWIQPEDPSAWDIFLTKCHFPVAGAHAGVAMGKGPLLTAVSAGKTQSKTPKALQIFHGGFYLQILHLETERNKRPEARGNSWAFLFQMISSRFPTHDDSLQLFTDLSGARTPLLPPITLTPHPAAPHPRPCADQCPVPPPDGHSEAGGPAGTTQLHRGPDLAQGGPRSPAAPSTAQRRKIK